MASLRHFTLVSLSFHAKNLIATKRLLFSHCKAIYHIQSLLFGRQKRCYTSEVELTSVRYDVKRGNFAKVGYLTDFINCEHNRTISHKRF